MSDPGPRSILITGATGAIGGALAGLYAQPGVKIYLHGRHHGKLVAVAEHCRAKGAEVETQLLDLRDLAALRQWIGTVGSLDLVIINAGMNTHNGPAGEMEPWDAVDALVDVNLKATMVIARAVVPGMRAQGRGQIAMMSSLAARFGLPVTPAYCASKAGVKAYGEALRGWLAGEGIRVNVIMPGYVMSPMCDDMPGPKPFLWTAERAARVIRRGLDRDQARISFPFPLNLGAWFLGVLPAALATRVVRRLGYGK